MFTELLVLIILIVLNAFFAASEIALISMNDTKLKLMAEEGNKRAVLLKKLVDEPSKFLATIQIGITLAGFFASAFAADNFSERLVDLIKLTGVPIPDSILKNVSVILITIVLSYFSLVFGELVPKRVAMKKAESIAMLVASPLNFLSSVTSPFVMFLTFSTNTIVRIFGIDPNKEEDNVTEEEIRMMVDVGEEKGAIDETEKEMINNIFEFNNKVVSEIMTHRTEISALPVDATLDEVIELINTEKYSRIPVYEDTIDNIIGIMHSKYLIKYIAEGGDRDNFDLRNLIRKPYYVPTSKRTDELFKELQRQRIHMAVIIDEYGGTAGIVTLEDLLEEIVGNIFDEDDEVEKEIEKIDENTFIINGTTSLDTVRDYLEVDLPTDDYDTLSGFLIGQLGRIPEENDKPSIEFNGLVFKIDKVDEKRVAKVKVCKA
ncbi:MAG TPA: hemolysin family protein [Acetivibrio clariflavus]|mgnify:FL=1|nr:hemolysin family protein [Acetivibrio clariflavus]